MIFSGFQKVLRSCLCVSVLAGLMFVSCQKTDTTPLFMTSMEAVDNYIKIGQTGDALRLLKKSEKNASSPLAKIGLYRRYMILSEKTLAEKVLVKGLKKFRGNNELSAVYGHFLLRAGRTKEAEKISSVLAGTKYGSIYSEAVLKNRLTEDKLDIGYLLGLNFASIYYDMYTRTENNAFLRNVALVYMVHGEYAKAAALQPAEFYSYAECMFWAFVQFDAGNFDLCLKDVNLIKADASLAEAFALASDAYMKLDESDAAESERNRYISFAEDASEKVPAYIAVNSAIWAYKNEKYKKAYDLISDALEENSLYIPALLTYSKFAVEDSKPVVMTDLEKTVRETTLRTQRMKAFDERPKFLMDEAISKLDKAVDSIKASGKQPDGSLLIERASLYLTMNDNMPLNAKTAFLWKELELNELGANLYPEGLVQLTVQKLLSYGLENDARMLFSSYIKSKYLSKKEDEKKDDNVVQFDIFGGERKPVKTVVPESIARLAFGDEVSKASASMNVWEVEYAAYFSLLDGNVLAAKHLFEYVLFETGGVVNRIDSGKFGSISSLAAPSSAVNLAMIYSSSGEKDKALALYGLASGKERDPVVKSSILYRIASIQNDMGDTKNAALTLDYCIALDPQNANARLLKRMIVH